MSRTVHLRPAVIILALGFGGVLAGSSASSWRSRRRASSPRLLGCARNRPEPQSPLAEPEAEAVPG